MDEHELQRALRHAAGLFDPVTTELLHDAVRAHELRAPGAELAWLTFDSRTAPVAVRGGTRTRLLTFGTPASTVDVEATRSPAGHRVVGQLAPARPAEITVRGRRPVSAVADRLGRFGFDRLPGGPFSLRVRPYDAEGGALATEWIVL